MEDAKIKFGAGKTHELNKIWPTMAHVGPLPQTGYGGPCLLSSFSRSEAPQLGRSKMRGSWGGGQKGLPSGHKSMWQLHSQLLKCFIATVWNSGDLLRHTARNHCMIHTLGKNECIGLRLDGMLREFMCCFSPSRFGQDKKHVAVFWLFFCCFSLVAFQSAVFFCFFSLFLFCFFLRSKPLTAWR